jgi:hypothetical protein
MTPAMQAAYLVFAVGLIGGALAYAYSSVMEDEVDAGKEKREKIMAKRNESASPTRV